MNPLLELINHGQSYWLDNLTRKMIRNGELEKRVVEQGLRGVTSNPAIFNKAITGSDDYNEEIAQLAKEGKSVLEIYETLVIKDIQDACDILRPVYDDSKGIDGYISLEVSPYLAHDTEATMQEARRLFKLVNRPNVMIKIPGTPAGVPAIEQMLYEGLNINVTLLFSVESYEEVALAYIKALERRLSEGKPLDTIASVASFFLSRIDVMVDQLLGHYISPSSHRDKGVLPQMLMGKTAIASAKLAYRRFREIFSGARWEKLEKAGARVQRPLWASTSTKDPIYDDIMYVTPLIGPQTVNTLPNETIDAFADHGSIQPNSIEDGVDEARQLLEDLSKVGINLDAVNRQLVNEGVQKFINPFDTLMSTIARKRQEVLEEKLSHQQIFEGKALSKQKATYKSINSKQFGRRLFQKDTALWTDSPEVARRIEQRLGWLDTPFSFQKRIEEINAFTEEVKSDGIQHVVLLGMGGSSLCPDVMNRIIGSADGWPQFFVLDNTHPDAVRALEKQLNLDKTLFIVSSKSGTTLETLSFYRYFYERVSAAIGEAAPRNFVAITDPGTPLAKEAEQKSFRKLFENPPDIGGRYSALSYFGLVPMALMGIDIAEILQNAVAIYYSSEGVIPPQDNPALSLGVALGNAYIEGKDKLTFVISNSLQPFGDWVEQLIAESTGKEGKGILPVVGEPRLSPEKYEADRLFVHIFNKQDTDSGEGEFVEQLKELGHPVIEIALNNELELGGEFLRWEIATAIAGALLRINPFDEPNVAESKNNTSQLLQIWKKEGHLSEEKPDLVEGPLELYNVPEGAATGSVSGALKAFLKKSQAGDFLGILAYLPSLPEFEKSLQSIRVSLQKSLTVPITFGWGPRYLHSTGQLHKGGKNNGLFLMITAEASEKLPIPGEPFDFATLQKAQALGDFQSLKSKERRIVRIHIRGSVQEGLNLLNEILKG